MMMGEEAVEWKQLVGESYDAWKDATPVYKDDGKVLQINGRAVMEQWETPYMQELASVVGTKGGRVLEVGFGMGISAGFIQDYDAVSDHVILEANKHIFQHLVDRFARTAKRKVTPLFGFWQEVTPTLESGSFDAILFDPYPINPTEHDSYAFLIESFRLLRSGGVLTYYSGEAEYFSTVHLEQIYLAGFTEIEYKLVNVEPPPECEYWNSPTLLSPRLTKL